MRNFGGLCLLVGVLGFFYCSNELHKYQGIPEGTSISASMNTPAGRLELGRYASAFAAFVGVLMSMFPKGR